MKEEDIRPIDIFTKYLKLAEQDCINFFKGEAKNEFKCPVHENAKGRYIFSKNGFSYKECEICSSIFVSPRHDLSRYENFYLNGASVKFWSKEFYKKTEEARKDKLWRPKVEELCKSEFLDYSIDKYSIIDIGGGYGAFAEIIQEKNPRDTYVVEPNKELAKISKIAKAKDVVFKPLEKLERIYQQEDYFFRLGVFRDRIEKAINGELPLQKRLGRLAITDFDKAQLQKNNMTESLERLQTLAGIKKRKL